MNSLSETPNLTCYHRQYDQIQRFVKQSAREHRKNAIALLTGMAGVGKTRLITELEMDLQKQIKMKVLNVLNLITPHIGIKDVLETLVQQGVLVIVFDEFEMIHDQAILKPVLSFIKKHSNIIFILISNSPNKLKKEHWPVVNFQLELPLPEKKQRVDILKELCSNPSQFSEDIDYEEIGSQTKNMTAADLTCLVREAQFFQLRQLKKQNPDKDFNFFEDMHSKGQLKVRNDHFKKIIASWVPQKSGSIKKQS